MVTVFRVFLYFSVSDAVIVILAVPTPFMVTFPSASTETISGASDTYCNTPSPTESLASRLKPSSPLFFSKLSRHSITCASFSLLSKSLTILETLNPHAFPALSDTSFILTVFPGTFTVAPLNCVPV